MATGVASVYLVAYNVAQALGWGYVLFLILREALASGRLDRSFSAAARQVCAYQLGSALEVAHAALGLVRSSWPAALMQWLGRSHVLFAVLMQVPSVQRLPAVFITFAAWSVSEVIRYPQYALTLAGACPRWMTWLRYTAFIVLYPLGVFPGEMWLMYSAIPYIRRKRLYEGFFQYPNLGYDKILLGLLVVWPILWLQLYVYMFKQRAQKLGGAPAPSRPTKQARRSKRE